MNIGLITPYYTDKKTLNSGIANHVSILAEALGNVGNKVVIVHIRPAYTDEKERFQKTIISNQILLLTYKAALPKWINNLFKSKWTVIDFLLKLQCMFIAARNLKKIKNEYNLQVIETSSYFSLCYFYLFTNPKIPVIIRASTTFLQMMDNYYPFKSRLYRSIGYIEIMMLKKSKYLITHANDHAAELKQLYKLSSKDFHIIPHGIDLPTAPSPLFKTTRPLKVLYVGRLEYRKGIDILLQAIPLIIKKYPDTVFKLIGIDENKAYEHKFQEENAANFKSKVTFIGLLDKQALDKAYSDCDIFVAPSRYESFGLIYIEAMSYGKPVIGCKVGGVSEIILDNQNGLFAIPGDPVSLAEKIISLCVDDTLRTRLGSNARETVENRFTKEILAANSLAYYQKVI
jgi:glycosyltransferase involved in cell wall biosynthesis